MQATLPIRLLTEWLAKQRKFLVIIRDREAIRAKWLEYGVYHDHFLNQYRIANAQVRELEQEIKEAEFALKILCEVIVNDSNGEAKGNNYQR